MLHQQEKNLILWSVRTSHIKRKTRTQNFDMFNQTESSEYLRYSEILRNHNFPVIYHNVG